MDDLDLTADQTEKIVQFQDLTGIENLSVCRDALHRHSWDLEVAVQDQLNISEGRPSVFASSESAASPINVVSDGTIQHVFYSPPSGLPRWGGPFGYFVSFVFQFCYNTLTSILKFAYSIFWRETRRPVTDPVGDVLQFINTFNGTISQTHPVFYQGSYSQALNDAKQELKFLIVYLNEEGNQDCTNFCRETLTDPNVIDCINGHSLFWACSTSTGEGERVSHTLRASAFPFLAVILYKESRMTLVARMEGPANSDELVTRLTAVMHSNESYLERARSERLARSLTQRIRLEQDAAYMESLRVDQEKERKRTEEEEKRRRLVEEEEDRRKKEALQKEEIRRLKVDLANRVPSEPPATEPTAVSIVFKLPSGDRLERRFLPVHTLADVYNFVFCHPSSPDVFEISANFPKRVLHCQDSTLTLSDAGLGKREVLFINDLDA